MSALKIFGSPLLRPRVLFPEMFNGVLFGWTLWMFRPNLKFVVLPVPEIIRVPKKFGQSLDVPTLFSLKFLTGFCSKIPRRLSYFIIRRNLWAVIIVYLLLKPMLWSYLSVQVFQCLLIDGENSGEEALRNAERFVVSDEQFQTFVDRHRSVRCLVPESNSAMRSSSSFYCNKGMTERKPTNVNLKYRVITVMI